MDTTQGFLLVSGILCAGVSFFLSGLETGLVEVSRLRLRRMAREGNMKASQLLRYLDDNSNFTAIISSNVREDNITSKSSSILFSFLNLFIVE